MKKILTISSLVLIILFSTFSNCFAAANYTDVTSLINKRYYAYVVFTLMNGDYTVRVIESDTKDVIDSVTFYRTRSTKMLMFKTGSHAVNVNQYIFRNGAWELTSTTYIEANTQKQLESLTYSTFYESTKDVLYSDNGEVFFQLTLPEKGLLETTLEMITTETPEVGTKVVAQMRTILLCGVGCLALLITLPLLVRVLRRYLGR